VDIHPVVALVGAGSVHGNAITCQEVALPIGVHPKETDVGDNPAVVKATGLGHAGAGAQVTLANQPEETVVPLEVNTNVKQPEGADEVNDGGKVVPDKVANKVPEALFPSYTFKISEPACVLKAVKVTVTASPGFTGQITGVRFSLLP
jgi:hypothetical protein